MLTAHSRSLYHAPSLSVPLAAHVRRDFMIIAIRTRTTVIIMNLSRTAHLASRFNFYSHMHCRRVEESKRIEWANQTECTLRMLMAMPIITIVSFRWTRINGTDETFLHSHLEFRALRPQFPVHKFEIVVLQCIL